MSKIFIDFPRDILRMLSGSLDKLCLMDEEKRKQRLSFVMYSLQVPFTDNSIQTFLFFLIEYQER